MPFTQLNVSPHLIKVLNFLQYEKPYPIQEQAIPAILAKNDVLGIAATGSGKTASYVLPILMNIEKYPALKNRHIHVLVMVPTRELAIQVNEVFKLFGKAMPLHIKSLAVYGGVSINTQMQDLQDVNILIATPGRLLELIENNAVKLMQLECLVLDEADKILNLGFQQEMMRIISLLPSKRQNLLFSATLSADLQGIQQLLLKEPKIIKIEQEAGSLDLITQTGYLVSEEKRGPLLRYIIQSKNMQQVLVFCSSVYEADNVADKLRKNGIDAAAIHSKKSQSARIDSLNKFKNAKLRVLVATDLVSRGIDIQFLPYVINYELPRSPKDYIHRIGRTGRAESAGEAISLVIPDAEHHFKVIQKKMGKWVTMINAANFELK